MNIFTLFAKGFQLFSRAIFNGCDGFDMAQRTLTDEKKFSFIEKRFRVRSGMKTSLSFSVLVNVINETT